MSTILSNRWPTTILKISRTFLGSGKRQSTPVWEQMTFRCTVNMGGRSVKNGSSCRLPNTREVSLITAMTDTARTVGMPLQTLHFAYLPDERASLSERPFHKGKPRLKVRLIPESRYQAADIYFCEGLDSAPLCENWSEIAQK